MNEPSCLSDFQKSIDRHLAQTGRTYSIVGDREFFKSQEALKVKKKHLRIQGKGRKPNKAREVTSEEFQKMWGNGQLSAHSPHALLNTVWLNNCSYFGWRAVDEHQKVLYGDVKLRTPGNGDPEYVKWLIEWGTKTRNGVSGTSKERNFNPKFYTTGELNHCPVMIFKAFIKHHSEVMKNESHPLYLGVIHQPRSNIWFKTSELGERSLRSVMKNMADAVELLGKKVSNHSAQCTCITTLRQENIDNLSIAGLSGHHNLLSLDDCSMISEEQQREMAYIISKRLGQTGQKSGVCSTLGHNRSESICQPL